MSIKRRDLTTVIAIGIILGALAASQARADVRVSARLRVPGGVIQMDHPGHGRTWNRFMRCSQRLGRDRMPAHREPNQRRDIDDRHRRW